MNIQFVLVLLCAFSVSYGVFGEKIVVCYYGSWATYRHGLGKYDVENINTDLCTHLMYSFVGINSQGTVISLDPYLDLDNGKNNFRKFTALKDNDPKLKTILAVGGWNEGSGKYSMMAANPTLRQNFIQSALKMILDYGFDGLDLDWEYPNRRDSVHGVADVANFVQLLKELREAFDKHGLLVSAAVSAVGNVASLSYDIPAISKYLNFISLMTYDMYGAWDPVTGHNAPLHKGEGDENADKIDLHTVDMSLEYWLNQGCPPEKLVVGIPLYGRSFTLTNANVNGVRASASGAGLAGPYTATSGFLGYNEICSNFRAESWDIKYDSLAKVPYAVRNSNWVSFDDAESVFEKVQYSQQFNIAGAMVWSIETDDFNGVCGEDYPLLRAINRALNKNSDSDKIEELPITSSSAAPTTILETDIETSTEPIFETTPEIFTSVEFETSTEHPWFTEAPSDSICKEEGFAADPEDCASFYMCLLDVDDKLKAQKFRCPVNLYWDHQNLFCNYYYLVECNI